MIRLLLATLVSLNASQAFAKTGFFGDDSEKPEEAGKTAPLQPGNATQPEVSPAPPGPICGSGRTNKSQEVKALVEYVTGINNIYDRTLINQTDSGLRFYLRTDNRVSWVYIQGIPGLFARTDKSAHLSMCRNGKTLDVSLDGGQYRLTIHRGSPGKSAYLQSPSVNNGEPSIFTVY